MVNGRLVTLGQPQLAWIPGVTWILMGVDLGEKMIVVINLVLGPLFLGRVIRTSLVMDALTKR